MTEKAVAQMWLTFSGASIKVAGFLIIASFIIMLFNALYWARKFDMEARNTIMHGIFKLVLTVGLTVGVIGCIGVYTVRIAFPQFAP